MQKNTIKFTRLQYKISGAKFIFLVPSSPVISPGALSSTTETITLYTIKVSSPVGELRDKTKIIGAVQHPGGQNLSDDGWSSDGGSNITITGLTPGTSYKLYIISTLGDGNTSCDTNQDGRTDNVLRSTPSIVIGCTRERSLFAMLINEVLVNFGD